MLGVSALNRHRKGHKQKEKKKTAVTRRKLNEERLPPAKTKNATIRCFSADTRNQVMAKFLVRWSGLPPTQVGLKKPAHVLATFLGPYTTPSRASLPLGWEADCRTALSQFYKGIELEHAMDELKALISRRGG